MGALGQKPEGEGCFTGDAEGYVKEGSRSGHLSPYGPLWESGGELVYQRDF